MVLSVIDLLAGPDVVVLHSVYLDRPICFAPGSMIVCALLCVVLLTKDAILAIHDVLALQDLG